MSTWQEKAREALTSVWEADCLCGADGCQTEEQAILAALAPVVEAEVRRAKVEALRGAVDQYGLSIPDRLGYTVRAVATEDLLSRADAIEAGDPR